MSKDTNGHTLTEKQRIQQAEVEAAEKKSGNTTTDTNTGGSDANSGPAANAAPISGETPPGNPPRVPTTTGTTRP